MPLDRACVFVFDGINPGAAIHRTGTAPDQTFTTPEEPPMTTPDFVTWDTNMSVGVDVLDDDHRRLIDMFNGLLRTNVATRGKDDLKALLTGLRDYTDVHFSREEGMMREHGYPDLDSHLAAHRYFIDEIAKLHDEFESGHAMMLRIDLILLLKEWLIEHIQTTDVRYRPYMADAPAH